MLTSVVPQITPALAECARHYTGRKPVIVSPEIRTGLTMGVTEPNAVGKDRLVDAAYGGAFPAAGHHGGPGTATTFSVVDKQKCSGRCDLPGAFHRAAGLWERCAQLPQVRLVCPVKLHWPGYPKARCSPAQCWGSCAAGWGDPAH